MRAALKALHNLARRWWLYTLLTCWIQIEHQYEAHLRTAFYKKVRARHGRRRDEFCAINTGA
jgi:hypothetical protein